MTNHAAADQSPSSTSAVLIQQLGSMEHLEDCIIHLSQGGLGRRFARAKKTVPAAGDTVEISPRRLTHQTLGPVPLSGVAHLPAGREAEPADRRIVRPDYHDQKRMMKPPAMPAQ